MQPLCCSIRVPALVAKPCLSTKSIPMSQSYRSASRQTIQSILDSNQEHVLEDWNALSLDQQSQLASALGAIDIPYVMRCFQQSMQAAGDDPPAQSACPPSLQAPVTHKLACRADEAHAKAEPLQEVTRLQASYGWHLQLPMCSRPSDASHEHTLHDQLGDCCRMCPQSMRQPGARLAWSL